MMEVRRRCDVEIDSHDQFMCMNPYRATTADDDEEASIGDISDRPVDRLHEQRLEPLLSPIKPRDNVTETEEQDVKKQCSVIAAGVESIKYLSSFLILVCSVFATIMAMATRQTVMTSVSTDGSTSSIPPLVALIMFFSMLSFLAVVECGESCLTGLQSIAGEKYAMSHPIAYKNTYLTRGDRMQQFVMGRQFLAVLILFTVRHLAAPIPNPRVLWLSYTGATETFLWLNFAMILTVIVVGQLTMRVHASACKLDFMNSYLMLVTSYVSLAVGRIGLFHCVYMFEGLIKKITRCSETARHSDGVRGCLIEHVAFWSRSILSLALLSLSLCHIYSAAFRTVVTSGWQGENVASGIILLLFLCLIFIMEGMPVAFNVINGLPKEERDTVAAEIAMTETDFFGDLFSEKLDDLRFGRKICITVCTFVIASISSSSSESCCDEYPILIGFDKRSGPLLMILSGAMVVTVASLTGRVVASSYPVCFLFNPIMKFLIRICLLFEWSNISWASFVLARYHRLLVAFQPDNVYLEGEDRRESEPITRKEKDIDRVVTIVKYSVSFVILILSVVFLSAAIIGQNRTLAVPASSNSLIITTSPVCQFILFWFLLLWLAMMEGGQGCLISLGSINKDKYASSHPLTLENVTLAQKGDNIERFIMGRQFLVFLIDFAINLMCVDASQTSVSDVLGLPVIMDYLFLSTGVAMIFTTIIIGQLMAQVNAAVCMLDFINNYLMLFTTYVSLLIELSGILHSVYIVQIIFSKATGQRLHTKESPRTFLQNVFFWGRVLMSLMVLIASFVTTVMALLQNKTFAFKGVPGPLLLVVFVVLMCFVGLFEGIQIALFAVINMPEKAISKYKVAKANCNLVFRSQNLQALLIGRQFCVTTCMFVVARITMLDFKTFGGNDNGTGETGFGASHGIQQFLSTGLLGALITTIVASLAWRIVASSFPLAFLSNPLIYLIIRLCLFVEASGVCSVAWILARLHKLAVEYQRDEVYLEGAPKETSAPGNKRAKDVDITVTVIKYMYSTALLLLSLRLVIALILSEQTMLTSHSHPYAAFVFFLFLLAWLAVMEGGQGCLIALQSVDKKLYASSHPHALRCTTLSHKGDNLERFIVGRQFLVFVTVFMANFCLVLNATMSDEDKSNLFLTSGAAIILTTIILGQLTAQVTAANCMLDFINNHFMLFTTYVSLMIEFTGILHAAYLVQFVFAKVARIPMKTNEPPRTIFQKVFFWSRVCISLTLLVLSFAITLSAMILGKTTSWKDIPEALSVFLFFGLMVFVGLMEGLQIALFEVINMSDERFNHAKIARAIRDLAVRDQNLQAILIGRQICVTSCMFVVARITTLNVKNDDENIFGVSPGLQRFFNTGLLGAFISTIVASLAWRIVASSFPIAFLSNPLIYLIMRVCLLVEKSGICSASWLFALFHKALAGFRVDEVYLNSSNLQDVKVLSSSKAQFDIDEGNSLLYESFFPLKEESHKNNLIKDFFTSALQSRDGTMRNTTERYQMYGSFGSPEEEYYPVMDKHQISKDIGSDEPSIYSTGKKEETHATALFGRCRSEPVPIPLLESTSRADTDLFDDDEEENIAAQANRFSLATRRMYNRIVRNKRRTHRISTLFLSTTEEERRGLLLSLGAKSSERNSNSPNRSTAFPPGRRFQLRPKRNDSLFAFEDQDGDFCLLPPPIDISNAPNGVDVDRENNMETPSSLFFEHTPEEGRYEGGADEKILSLDVPIMYNNTAHAATSASSKLKPQVHPKPSSLQSDLCAILEKPMNVSESVAVEATNDIDNSVTICCEIRKTHPIKSDDDGCPKDSVNSNLEGEGCSSLVVVSPCEESMFVYETPPNWNMQSPLINPSQEVLPHVKQEELKVQSSRTSPLEKKSTVGISKMFLSSGEHSALICTTPTNCTSQSSMTSAVQGEPPLLTQREPTTNKSKLNAPDGNSSIGISTKSLLNGGILGEDNKLLRMLGFSCSSADSDTSSHFFLEMDDEDRKGFPINEDEEEVSMTVSQHGCETDSFDDTAVDFCFIERGRI